MVPFGYPKYSVPYYNRNPKRDLATIMENQMGLLPLLRVWGGYVGFKILRLRKLGYPK